MPGPAPAKVQHWAVKLTKLTGEEHTPVWNEDQQAWTFTIDQSLDCNEVLHQVFHKCLESSSCTENHTGVCEQGSHTVKLELACYRSGSRYGLDVWKTREVWLSLDSLMCGTFPASELASLLAKPTNPEGDGKVGHASSGSNKQNMDVKRTTVIRV